jgi:PST family polysaccharide transporter
MGALLTTSLVLCAPLIADFYDEPRLRLLTVVLAFSFLMGSFRVVQEALLTREMAFQRLANVEIAATCLAGCAAVVMALRGCGIWSLAVLSLGLTAATSSALWIVSRWRPTASWDRGALRELLGFSSPLLGFNILNYWIRNLDGLLVGRFIGSFALGLYSRAQRLMLLPLTQISTVVSRVMFPAFSEIQHEIPALRAAYLRATRLIALISFPMMVGLLAAAESFILTVYGKAWAGVVPLLQVLCLTGLEQSVSTTVGWIYNSLGRTDIQFRWGLFAGAVRATAVIIGLRWGVLGVAVSYAVSGSVILWYPGWAIPGKLVGLRFREMVVNLRPIFACALSMGLGVWLLGYLIGDLWPQWMRLAVQTASGVFLYWVLIHACRLNAYTDFCSLARERLRRTARRAGGNGAAHE